VFGIPPPANVINSIFSQWPNQGMENINTINGHFDNILQGALVVFFCMLQYRHYTYTYIHAYEHMHTHCTTISTLEKLSLTGRSRY